MIKYRLICVKGHEFDGWFSNSAAFDSQQADGHLACPDCGSAQVKKAVMAPAVPVKGNRQSAAQMRQMADRLNRQVEESFDYVGADFAEEARKIHYGEADERDIYGEASLSDAKQLLEEGVPVAPLPGRRRRDTH